MKRQWRSTPFHARSPQAIRHSAAILLLAVPALFCSLLQADPLGTAFTYQGRLQDGTNAANGLYDLRFALYDAASAGNQVGLALTNSAVAITNGVFTVLLDFGANVFDGNARWLETAVRTNGVGAFGLLPPRQPLTPAPYALYAASAGVAGGVTAGSVTSAALAPGAVNAGNIASGQVVKSLNGLADTVALLPGLNVSFSTNANTLTISAAGGGPTGGWSLTGNAGIVPGVNFLGTTDNHALELRAVNQPELFLFGGSLRMGTCTNGYHSVALGAQTTAGGVTSTALGYETMATGNYSTATGSRTTASGGFATAGGSGTAAAGLGSTAYGMGAKALADYSTAFGSSTSATNTYAVAMGGATVASGSASVALGASTTASGFAATALGYGSEAEGSYALAAGSSTRATGDYSVALGDYAQASGEAATATGSETVASGAFSTALGYETKATKAGSVAMGAGTSATGEAATALGTNTTASGWAATAMGGSTTADGFYSTAMGCSTRATNYYATAMGFATRAEGGTSTAMGDTTLASGIASTAMGQSTVASGSLSTALGQSTVASGHVATALGVGTVASGYASIAMGSGTTASGDLSTAMGRNTLASGDYATALGYLAQATNNCSFVWSDGTSWARSTSDHQFMARASGGVVFYTSAGSSGAFLPAGGGSWLNLSDRNCKEEIRPVNSREVLEKVVALRVTSWKYKTQDPSVRHLGPMAQDFKAAFSVGETDTGIAAIDADGVALAAIQGLNQKVEEQAAVLRAKEARIADLEQQMTELKTLVTALARKMTETRP